MYNREAGTAPPCLPLFLLALEGYHLAEDLPWLDAVLNQAMILTGMGPVDRVHTVAGKLFATAYAYRRANSTVFPESCLPYDGHDLLN